MMLAAEYDSLSHVTLAYVATIAEVVAKAREVAGDSRAGKSHHHHHHYHQVGSWGPQYES